MHGFWDPWAMKQSEPDLGPDEQSSSISVVSHIAFSSAVGLPYFLRVNPMIDIIEHPQPSKNSFRTHSEKTPPAQHFPRCFPRKSVRVENLCPVYHDPLHLEDVDAAPSAPPATTTGEAAEAKEERRQPEDARGVWEFKKVGRAFSPMLIGGFKLHHDNGSL